MSDIKGCDKVDPHVAHSWERQSMMPYGHRQYYHCPGVPEPEVLGIDLLTTPVGVSNDISAIVDIAKTISGVDESYSYSTPHMAWACPDCYALTTDPALHDAWHRRLDRESTD